MLRQGLAECLKVTENRGKNCCETALMVLCAGAFGLGKGFYVAWSKKLNLEA
jgi:hypothetical protein